MISSLRMAPFAKPNDRPAPGLITTSGENGNISRVLLTGKEFALASIANLSLALINMQVLIATGLAHLDNCAHTDWM